MMIKNKWLISFLLAVVITIISFGGLMYYLDPLLQYGKESPPLTYYTYAEMYSNPGIAQHYDYDTVLVGTSMIENTDIDEFDKLLGTKAVRLPYSGGTARNMKTILDICFESHNDIKAVYWELDEYQLFSKYNETRYPLPDYLYRNDKKEDISYLLNLDIFYHYGINDILGTLRGQKQKAERRGETFGGTFEKNAVLKSYNRPKQSETKRDIAEVMKKTEDNLSHNIKPLIEGYPDTQFVFYFVPFSILYWDQEVRNGNFDSTITAVEYAIGQLLSYENVTVYFFHNEKEIITNLDNYKDYSHYGTWINSYISKSLAQGKNRLTKETYKMQMEIMRNYINSYDFETLFVS